jgi:hypothetical protein
MTEANPVRTPKQCIAVLARRVKFITSQMETLTENMRSDLDEMNSEIIRIIESLQELTTLVDNNIK